ncbi:hypothetical protein TIFTF001_042777 [Ficus carica]|uniref:Uncharacterized protein n=1 Tax=Ficus carica TaxID=3494 RepID=A0AA88CUJ6_FICCA|nr:hypothetical protein TIFTF001_042777 [Ficus carica]
MGMYSRASTPIQLYDSSPSFPNGCPFTSNETSIRSPFVLTMWTLLMRVALRLPSSSGLNLEGRLAAWKQWGRVGMGGVGGVGAWAAWAKLGSRGRGRSWGVGAATA